MRLIAHERCHLLSLIVMDEMRPLAGVYMPSLLHGIAQRYKFAISPTNVEDSITKGAKFSHGTMTRQGQSILVSDIGIYNDGIVVGALTTDYADEIADDLLSWAVSAFSLRQPTTQRPRTYGSNVVVEFDRLPRGSLKKYQRMSSRMSAALKASRGWDCEIGFQRLAFQADPTTLLPHMTPATSTQFSIERRGGIPYTENRFWCAAPLRSTEHLEMLKEIEADFANVD